MGYLPFRFRGLECHPRVIHGKVNWLNDLKLSVGYGITGNQTGLDPYKTLELYGTDGVYYDTGSWLPSYKISQNANPDLNGNRQRC